MPNHIWRSAVVVAVAAPLFLVSASAQTPATPEKAAPKTLAFTTSNAAARTALNAALDEVENIGGGRRFDAKLKAAIDADPQFALGRAYYANWGSTLDTGERMKQLDQAVRDAASASTPELLFVIAIRESRAGRNAQARDQLELVMKMVPDDPHVLFVRNLIAASVDDGIAVSNASVQKFPDFAPAYNLLAYRLNAAGRQDDAIAAAQKYAMLMPNHPNPHDTYAEILSFGKRFDESDQHYQRALELDPDYEVAHEGLAENAFRRGNSAAARPHIEQSLAAAATPQRKIALHRELAVTYLFESNFKAAEQQLGTSIQIAEAASLQPSAQTDHRNLGIIAATQRKSKEAVQHYNAGISTNRAGLMPLTDAIFHGVLGHASEVATAKTEMARNAASMEGDAAQDAVHLTELIYAVVSNDVAAAREHHGRIVGAPFRALGAAFLTRPLARAGDLAGSKATMMEVGAYREMNMNAALAHLIARGR